MKKIRIDDLRIGMVVVKMDHSWISHPFLTSRKRIASERQIRLLKESGVDEVYVDIAESPAGSAPAAEGAAPQGPPDAPVFRGETAAAPPDVPFAVEVRAARAVQRETHSVVRDVLRDVRLGRTVESEKVGRAVSGMIDSIFRNQDALTSLTRLKGYDEYTFVHSVNVCVLSLALGRALGLSRDDLGRMGVGALLHDTGKMRIPGAILNKTGKLSAEEFDVIKRHPAHGAEILAKAGGISESSIHVALQHHERRSGSGYPHGVSGIRIEAYAQIVSIMDVYDAMTTDRSYQKAFPAYEAIRRIYEWGKRDFNAAYVERFIQCVGIYPVGTIVQLDTGEIGVVSSINHEKLLRPGVILVWKDASTRYAEPRPADLSEPAGEAQSFRRTIVRPLAPGSFGIDPEAYLAPPEAAAAALGGRVRRPAHGACISIKVYILDCRSGRPGRNTPCSSACL